MQIRRAVASDLKPAAAIIARAWLHSPVNEYLLPYRNNHPSAYQEYNLRSLKSIIGKNQVFMVVAETEPSDAVCSGKSEIVGYATWMRMGEIEATRKIWGSDNQSWAKRLRERILDWDLIDNIYALFNPAASLLRALSYGNSDEIYFDRTYEEPKECWMLTHLSVDPECQKHGIGLKLCHWGLEYAKEEELPATLCSTIDGKRLYQKAGFRAVGSWQWAEGNDRTMSIMRWDSPDKKDRV